MINRRTLVLSAPAVAFAGTATAETVDPHAAWVAEHKAILARVFAPDAPDLEDDNPDWARAKDIEHRICRTPATTLAGAAAQLEFAISEEANFDMTGGVAGDLDGQVLRNVIDTLKSLTREVCT